jgi:predicted HicB family RNase H-like nuclease
VVSNNFSLIPNKNIIYEGMKKLSLSFKVDPRLKKALENLALKENRSLSNYVITLLMKHLEEQGIDWKKPDK